MGSSEIWPSDAGMFTEAAAGNLDSSALLALNPVSSDVSSGYSMFSDSDAGLSAFAMGSDGENTSNLVASCVGESNVDPSSGLDILMSRDSLDETWTSLAPATEENQCPSKQDPKPPPEPQLSIPSLLEYIDTDECPPLPDGRKRHALCCYDPDIVISPGNSVAKNCWRCKCFLFSFNKFDPKNPTIIHMETHASLKLGSGIFRNTFLGL